MSAIFWPSSLPQAPIYGGFQRQRVSSVNSFKPESGPPITSRRNALKTKLYSAEFIMSDLELDRFETFFDVTCKAGALGFYWDHPVNLRQAKWLFDPDQPWSSSIDGPGYHRVSISLYELV